ncbi:cysteine protease XCP2-like [Neltuma alba]|uniref:cysteine protease XCP2-like n=1 Tax=Neltuma alba TaxID=207710 RepID=UPI0010A57381|nr:cysteine protease XCP2-like [Prosopis alba]
MASLVLSKSLLLFFFSFAMICLSSCIPSSEKSILNYDDDLDKLTSEEDTPELFRVWQKGYKREYQTLEEKLKRFEIFINNVKYIRDRNTERTSFYDYHLGLNQFADMTDEEFKEICLIETEAIVGGKPGEADDDYCPNALDSLDWRDLGAVKDQGQCEQQLMSCDPYNYGCRGGYDDRAFEYFINNGGIASEADYSYTAENGTCNHRKAKKIAVTIDGYQNVTSLSENSLF